MRLKCFIGNEHGQFLGTHEPMIVIFFIGILLAIAIPLLTQYKKDTKTAIKGIYQESKGGPVVAGVLLFGMTFDEKYRGKTVEVTGDFYEDHELKCEPYEPGKPVKTCFDGPIMKNAEIKVVD